MNFNKYKIISIEDENVRYKYAYILLPCFCYEIQIECKDTNSNILQDTIKELVEVDSGLKNESQKLAKMLGFAEYDELIQLILEQIDSIEKTKPKIRQVYIFKERYGKSFLPFVLQEKIIFKEFTYFNGDFRVDLGDKMAYARSDFNNLSDERNLETSEIYKIFIKHNKNNQRNNLNVLNFNANNAEDSCFEALLLCKICFDRANNEKFYITDGYDNNYNTLLAEIFRREKADFLRELRKINKIDDLREETIKIPFKGLEKHTLLYDNVCKVQRESFDKDVALYAAFENVFEILSKNYQKCNENKANLIKLAKKYGFKIDKNDEILVLGGDKNLAQTLSRIFINDSNLAKDLAYLNVKLLTLLSRAKTCRDTQMHSASEVLNLDEKDFKILKDILYDLINRRLNIKFSQNNEIKVQNSSQNNALIDFEEEFKMEFLNEISQAKSKFAFAYKLLEKELNKAQYNEFIVHLYVAIEAILKQKIDDYLQLNKFDFKDKNSLISSLQSKNMQISALLSSIKDINIINAIKGENTTLNALYAVCLTFLNFSQDDKENIENIIDLRGHGECKNYEKFHNNAKDLFDKFLNLANRLINHI